MRIHEFGPPSVLQGSEIPIPAPAADEVLVRVAAAGVGPWDALIREGKSALVRSLPMTLGSDLAGRVQSSGACQTTFDRGAEVFGSTAGFVGAYAEYAVVPSRMLAAKPRRLSSVEAASVPIVAVTASQMLDRAEPVAGRTLLILGAAGAVGGFAVQMARERGAHVFAQLADVESPVDIVLDTVGGAAQTASAEVLKPGGSLISVVSPPDRTLCERFGIHGSFFYVDVNTPALETIARKLDAGELQPHVGTTLPLEDARRAHEMLAGLLPRAPGKIVLTVNV